ncbi:3TM-type holin [Thalassospira alkalitolerans]|uniref:3TM-type holin n=1 Tax=Thalassospira alkalitolerans TaxID=1293890 RepID=UPI0030EF3BCB|tara:strand:+ start:32460 stop:32948 length:489 start_codon:yes stop_codon:yes gene_type:complete
MIAALLAQIGLPLLMKAVGSGLDHIDNPIAKTAAEGLKQMGEAVTKGEVTPAQIAEANRHTERMAELELTRDAKVLATVNRTIRAEVQSEDAFVRRWRPSFGYAVALTWIMTMGSIAAAIILTPLQAPAIIAALVNTSPIWGIALGVLGVSVVKRSADKKLG